jgi:hypothetical protein
MKKNQIESLEHIAHNVHQRMDHLSGKMENSAMSSTMNCKNSTPTFEVIHPFKIKMDSCLVYYVLGELDRNWKSFNITLLLVSKNGERKERVNLDMYNRKELTQVAQELGSIFFVDEQALLLDFHSLTEYLENLRDTHFQHYSNTEYEATLPHIPHELKQKCIALLENPNLIDILDNWLQELDLDTERTTRLLLFFSCMSFKWSNPMKIILQKRSIANKEKILKVLLKIIPRESIVILDSIVAKNLMQLQRDNLFNKLIIIKDFDLFNTITQRTLLSLPSNGTLGRIYKYRNFMGIHEAETRQQKLRFAIVGICKEIGSSRGLYSSAFVIHERDSSVNQNSWRLTHRYEESDLSSAQMEYGLMIENCLKILKTEKVRIPKLDHIVFPKALFSDIEKTEAYVNLVKLIANFHQFQRKVDINGKLLAIKEDLVVAFEILEGWLFELGDDLERSTRVVYEQLRTFNPNGDSSVGTIKFSALQMRTSLGMSKTNCFRTLESLVKMGYVARVGGNANRGYVYSVCHLDSYFESQAIQKQRFLDQLNDLFDKEGGRDEASPY